MAHQHFVEPFVWRDPATLPTRMAAATRVAGVRYEKEANEFVFIDMNYGVDLDRIASPMDLIEWVVHLSGKTWVTTDQIEALCLCVCSVKGWTFRGE